MRLEAVGGFEPPSHFASIQSISQTASALYLLSYTAYHIYILIRPQVATSCFPSVRVLKPSIIVRSFLTIRSSRHLQVFVRHSLR